jgi:two-component system cell cycle sensor histidine kinase/response regulator CckA
MATILIVDDLSANREVLVALLRHQGHQLREAVDGSAGLAAVHAERPDLIITDVLMPVMDGYEFVRQLRTDPTTSTIPVVFYTAHYGEREARALAASAGVAHVLTKPVESEEVLNVVAQVLSGRSGVVSAPSSLPTDFDREHLRLVTDKLSEKAEDLKSANARLRALVNIGLELASERDSNRLLDSVCMSARELFGATYVTVGIVGRLDRTVERVVASSKDVAGWIEPGDAVPGILGTVVAERRELRGNNPGGDPARLQLPPRHPRVQSYLAAPVASPAHVYGWMCLVGNEGRMFSDDDESLAMALAGQVGRIYENGYFYAIAQKRSEELEHQMVERKRAEVALRHERDRAQLSLDTAEVILLALDVDGGITLINRYGCAMLGYTTEELLGRNWIDTCLPPRIRDDLLANFHSVIGGDVSVTENAILTRSGEERLIEWRNAVLRDDAGRVTGTFSSGTDITDRAKAIEALRTAEERMRFALQSADIGIWDMDYTTGVLRWSEIIAGHSGLQPGTFEGTFEGFIVRVHPD